MKTSSSWGDQYELNPRFHCSCEIIALRTSLPATMSWEIVIIQRYSKSNSYSSLWQSQWTGNFQLLYLPPKTGRIRLEKSIKSVNVNNSLFVSWCGTIVAGPVLEPESELPNRITYWPASVKICISSNYSSKLNLHTRS